MGVCSSQVQDLSKHIARANVTAVQSWLNQGKPIISVDSHGFDINPLLMALCLMQTERSPSRFKKREEIVTLLLEAPGVSLRTNYLSLLHYLRLPQGRNLIPRFIENGVDLDFESSKGETAVMRFMSNSLDFMTQTK